MLFQNPAQQCWALRERHVARGLAGPWSGPVWTSFQISNYFQLNACFSVLSLPRNLCLLWLHNGADSNTLTFLISRGQIINQPQRTTVQSLVQNAEWLWTVFFAWTNIHIGHKPQEQKPTLYTSLNAKHALSAKTYVSGILGSGVRHTVNWIYTAIYLT